MAVSGSFFGFRCEHRKVLISGENHIQASAAPDIVLKVSEKIQLLSQNLLSSRKYLLFIFSPKCYTRDYDENKNYTNR